MNERQTKELTDNLRT